MAQGKKSESRRRTRPTRRQDAKREAGTPVMIGLFLITSASESFVAALLGMHTASSGGGAGIRGFTLIVGARDLFDSFEIPFPSGRLCGPGRAGRDWKRSSAGHRRLDGGASFLCCARRGVLRA